MIDLELLNPNEVLKSVDELSHHSLLQKDDLEKIISIALQSKKIIELEELAFQAKYLSGLTKVIRKSDMNLEDEYIIKLRMEYQTAVELIKEKLNLILSDASSFHKEIFWEKYFQLTQFSLNNLNQLCSDLSFLKLYFNDLKTKKGSK